MYYVNLKVYIINWFLEENDSEGKKVQYDR